jgi:hypothetical protein
LLVSADGQRVVFSAGYDDPEAVEVWSVPLAATGAPMRISAEHPVGSDVVDLVTTASGRVLYRWWTETSAPARLSSVPVDGSAPTIFVDGGLVAGGSVRSMEVVEDDVVFVADAVVDNKRELWSAPIDGSGARTRRSAPLAADSDVWIFRVTPDGQRAVYIADAIEIGRLDLYSTTVSGFTSILRLSNLELFEPDYSAGSFEIADDSRTLVFETFIDNQFDGRLKVQDLREPTIAPVSLDTASEDVSFEPLDDGAAVGFVAEREGDSRREIHLADRRFFADGFESGDASRWSASSP